MPELEDESVRLVVTSPPYWCLKDYAHPGQIGFAQPYEEYLGDLREVLGECFRVLAPGCRAAVNIGDQYLRAGAQGRYRVQPIPADLIGIGQDLGYDFMGQIIWRKVSTTHTSGGGQWMGSTYWPRDGQITYEHEYILLLRKPGTGPRPSAEQKERSRLGKEERSRWFRGVWDDLPPARQQEHVAMFPLELPRRLILMYSFWGETVLDPFAGSGTTLAAAQATGRDGVGYEINPDFERLVRGKVEGGNLQVRGRSGTSAPR
jgi:site-specific DNA-methyltransferase (adenine-specific)